MKHIVYISIGSNLKNKLLNCCNSINNIKKNKNISIIKYSNFYLTSPTNYKKQNWFINTAIKIKTELSPTNLLNELMFIQSNLEKKIKILKYGPRIIDMDMIFYDKKIINTTNLTIPHPRMHERHFVLQPICDINPYFIHPILKISISSILNNLSDNSQIIIPIKHIIKNNNLN